MRRYYRRTHPHFHTLRLMIVVQRRWRRTGRYHRWLPHTKPERTSVPQLHQQLSNRRSLRLWKGVFRMSGHRRCFMHGWPLLRWRMQQETALDHARARQILRARAIGWRVA